MEKKLKQKGIAAFEGMNIGKNRVVTVKFKFRYDEIVTSVELLQGLNTDITVHAKTPSTSAMNLGLFTIGNLTFDKDGNATVQFKALTDNVNLDNLCAVVDEEYLQLRFMAVIEIEDKETDEKGDGDEDWLS